MPGDPLGQVPSIRDAYPYLCVRGAAAAQRPQAR